MFLILTNTVFVLTLFYFSFYFPKRNTCHVGFIEEKNDKAWCKISLMWTDTSWDNYILPVQSFNDYLKWEKKQNLLLFKILSIGLCIVMSFLCFTYQGKKKTQLQLVKTTEKKSFQKLFFPSPAHQNSSR